MANQNWYNNDGLFIQYGTDEAITAKSGELNVQGEKLQQTEYVVAAVGLSSTAATPTILDYTSYVPKGSRIHQIQTISEVACTSAGSPTLDFGFQRTDHSTELDYNGCLAAQAFTTVDGLGETTTTNFGSAAAGALVGTTLAFNGVPTVNTNSGTYTAGTIIIRLFYYYP